MSASRVDVPWRSLFVTTVVVNLYVQLSELVRYLAVVQPRLQDELSIIDEVGRIDPAIFAIWGLWGTLLSALIVSVYWLVTNVAGTSVRSAIVAGTLSWAMAFVVLWVGIANMQISSWTLPALALPFALIETLSASILARFVLGRLRTPSAS